MIQRIYQYTSRFGYSCWFPMLYPTILWGLLLLIGLWIDLLGIGCRYASCLGSFPGSMAPILLIGLIPASGVAALFEYGFDEPYFQTVSRSFIPPIHAISFPFQDLVIMLAPFAFNFLAFVAIGMVIDRLKYHKIMVFQKGFGPHLLVLALSFASLVEVVVYSGYELFAWLIY